MGVAGSAAARGAVIPRLADTGARTQTLDAPDIRRGGKCGSPGMASRELL